jgi:hypothetical protein
VSDTRSLIRDRIESLKQELATIPPHRFNDQKIADRRRMIELLHAQLDCIELMDLRSLEVRAELLARRFPPIGR